MEDIQLERMKAQILGLWQRIQAALEEERPALRAQYTRAFECYRAYRADLESGQQSPAGNEQRRPTGSELQRSRGAGPRES